MSLGGPTDRRQFLAVGGGMFLCTLGGQRVSLNKEADVDGLSSPIEVPPRVVAAQTKPACGSQTVPPQSWGTRREYWIKAEEVKWNIVPSGRDEMMGKKVKGKTKFTAYAYRAYTSG